MVIWLIGLSGSGKTFIGEALFKKIRTERKNTVFLDGDMIRQVMGDDLGHTIPDRKKNADRICRLCKLLDGQGINVVCSILSLFHESQEWNRHNYSEYFEVFIDVSFDVLKTRRPMYEKALKGEVTSVVGVDIEFKPPQNPHLILHNSQSLSSPLELVEQVYSKISQNIL